METVILTEAAIAGDAARTTPASVLRDSWIKASEELGVGIGHEGMAEYGELLKKQSVSSESSNLCDRNNTILVTESSLKGCLRIANKILNTRGDEKGVIVFTGSLHIVSSVLASLAN